MSDIELHQPGNMGAQMDYARAVSSASMLPDTYRGKPADILLAVGLGQSMGLSPAESLYRISVIKGKPTASAELIAANVRKAGHRLRVTGDETTATAVILRADDPDFEFSATRDLAWAERMGLAKNDNYKKQSGTMLRWRAITAVAREACPEALYGVAYTADELGDGSSFRAEQQPTTGLAAAMNRPTEPDPVTDNPPSTDALLDTSSNLAKAMYAGIRDAGIEDVHGFLSEVTGRDVTSSKELTEAEARMVLDNLPTQGELIKENQS